MKFNEIRIIGGFERATNQNICVETVTMTTNDVIGSIISLYCDKRERKNDNEFFISGGVNIYMDGGYRNLRFDSDMPQIPAFGTKCRNITAIARNIVKPCVKFYVPAGCVEAYNKMKAVSPNAAYVAAFAYIGDTKSDTVERKHAAVAAAVKSLNMDAQKEFNAALTEFNAQMGVALSGGRSAKVPTFYCEFKGDLPFELQGYQEAVDAVRDLNPVSEASSDNFEVISNIDVQALLADMAAALA